MTLLHWTRNEILEFLMQIKACGLKLFDNQQRVLRIGLTRPLDLSGPVLALNCPSIIIL